MPDIAFVTCRRWPGLSADDRLAAHALEERGCRVAAAEWNDPEVEWGSFDLIVVRSCWDYPFFPAAFRDWLWGLDTHGPRVVNPVPTILWNLDKGYLRDLAERGVVIPDTVFPEEGGSLADLMDARRWDCAVVKPRISAMAHGTVRVPRDDAGLFQSHLDSLVEGSGAIIQNYVPAVESTGELSLVFFGGEFSHAVLKKPAPGEFRVQADHGGTVARTDPGTQIIAQAAGVLDRVPLDWTYARVDGCVVEGTLVLMELELIEPALFLAFDVHAPDRFADPLLRRLG